MAKKSSTAIQSATDPIPASTSSDQGLSLLTIAGVVVAVCVAVSASTLHGAAPVDYPQERYQRLVQWVVSEGGFVSDKMEYVAATYKGAMLKSKGNIKSGERLILIPESVQISDDNVRRTSPKLARAVDGVKDLSLARSGVALIASWLSNQYERYMADPASVGGWRAYWDTFNPPLSMPFYRNKQDMLFLFGSFEFKDVSRHEFWYGRDHGLITKSCKSNPGSCDADVARMQLGTYQAMNQHILTHACKGPGDKPRILPVFEILNHNPEFSASLSYALDPKTGSAEVLATRDIDAGEELTISYGRNSNPERVANWGFADPPFSEPFWSVRIFTKNFAENYFPDMDTGDMEIDIRLATPWHKSLPDVGSKTDSADAALATLKEDLSRAAGSVPELSAVLETVANHFLEWYQQDRSIADFRDALEEVRADDASGSVWWAKGATWNQFSREAFMTRLQNASTQKRASIWDEASSVDKSDPQQTGNFWNSTAVRVKMTEYLCALAYKEALQYLRGEKGNAEIMLESLETAAAILKHLPQEEKVKFSIKS